MYLTARTQAPGTGTERTALRRGNKDKTKGESPLERGNAVTLMLVETRSLHSWALAWLGAVGHAVVDAYLIREAPGRLSEFIRKKVHDKIQIDFRSGWGSLSINPRAWLVAQDN